MICPDSTVNGSGQATCTVSDAIAGNYSATATYDGDTSYNGSFGSDTTAEVDKASSGASVIDSSSGVDTGGSFTFTAAVTGPGITPTGTVTWSGHRPQRPGELRCLDPRRQRPGDLHGERRHRR